MEGINVIEQYEDLSEEELAEYLDEIRESDDDIEEARAESLIKEQQLDLIESPENAEIEAKYGNDAWRMLNENTVILRSDEDRCKASLFSAEAIRNRAHRLKEDRIRIQRFAFDQEVIKMSSPIGNENIKLLISLLVEEHTRMINKHKDFINKRLTVLLNPFIPRRLRVCKMLYPDSVKASPGFLYRASMEYGKGLTFWAMPDIPYYFIQNTEQKILIDKKPEFLVSVDKAVSFYHEHEGKRAKKEIRYASTIIQKNVNTYFDLLKLNPFWFETLYNAVVQNNNVI